MNTVGVRFLPGFQEPTVRRTVSSQMIEIETSYAVPFVDPSTFHGARTVETAALLCHEANRGWCTSIGDNSQKSFLRASDHARESARAGVLHVLSNPDVTPEESHRSWLLAKREAGWVHGEVKDEEKKTHPCIVDNYMALPLAQRVKDHLFIACAKQALFSWGPRHAFLQQEEIPGVNRFEVTWQCTEPEFTYGMQVIIGRISAQIRAVLVGLARGVGYPAPTWKATGIAPEIQNMVNACMQSKSAVEAYDLMRQVAFPDVMPSLDAASTDPAEMFRRGSWFLAYSIVHAGLLVEGVTRVPRPRVSRWTYQKGIDATAIALSKETPTP